MSGLSLAAVIFFTAWWSFWLGLFIGWIVGARDVIKALEQRK